MFTLSRSFHQHTYTHAAITFLKRREQNPELHATFPSGYSAPLLYHLVPGPSDQDLDSLPPKHTLVWLPPRQLRRKHSAVLTPGWPSAPIWPWAASDPGPLRAAGCPSLRAPAPPHWCPRVPLPLHLLAHAMQGQLRPLGLLSSVLFPSNHMCSCGVRPPRCGWLPRFNLQLRYDPLTPDLNFKWLLSTSMWASSRQLTLTSRIKLLTALQALSSGLPHLRK